MNLSTLQIQYDENGNFDISISLGRICTKDNRYHWNDDDYYWNTYASWLRESINESHKLNIDFFGV